MSRPQFDLYRKTLNSVNFSENGDIAYFTHEKDKVNAEGIAKQGIDQITHGIVGMVLPNIEGVKVAVSHDLSSGGTSLRSATTPVNDIAEAFGGGGHKFAAGCSSQGKLGEILETISRKLSNN